MVCFQSKLAHGMILAALAVILVACDNSLGKTAEIELNTNELSKKNKRVVENFERLNWAYQAGVYYSGGVEKSHSELLSEAGSYQSANVRMCINGDIPEAEIVALMDGVKEAGHYQGLIIQRKDDCLLGYK